MDVIELNGNRYDALTGAYMTAPRQHDAAPKAAAPATAQPARQTAAPRHMPAHRPQHARTLMRRAVKKPQAAYAVATAPQPVAPVINSQAAVLRPVAPAKPLHKPQAASQGHQPLRLQRARSTVRSQHVARFSTGAAMPIAAAYAAAASAMPAVNIAPSTSAARLAPAPMPAAAPIAAPKPKPAPTPLAVPSMMSRRLRRAPAAQQLDIMPPPAKHQSSAAYAQPAQQPMTPVAPKQQPMQRMHQRRAGHAAGHLAAQTKAQTLAPAKTFAAPTRPQFNRAVPQPAEEHREQDIFEQALALATSHEQKAPKQSVLRAARRRKTLRRVLSIAASAAVFVALAGFIAYQNKASIELQMASAKAGFPASAAGYKPDGFNMSRVAFDAGAVATWYKSPDKTFSVIQKKSNWDSQTLLENHVATTSPEYQGYSANGRTVYVYGKGRATWVNGGIWYQIDAGDALSNEQLVKVAANM